MGEIDNAKLIVSGPLHNNEPTAAEVIEFVGRHPIQGVFPYLVPHEALVGMRFKGSRELGAHFPGDRDSDDPEDRVAARMVADLQPVAYWMGVDLHDSPLRNANFLCVADTSAPEQLGLAVVLGIDKVMVTHGYPFFKSFPRFVSVETTRDPINNPLSRPEHWHRQLETIARLGINGLRRMFEQKNDGLTYVCKILIPLIGRNALSMAQVVQLEHIPFNGEAFEKVELPIEVAELLGIGDRITTIGTWGHVNNAKERPDLGVTHEGVQRREYFGSVFVEIGAPATVDDTILHFVEHGLL